MLHWPALFLTFLASFSFVAAQGSLPVLHQMCTATLANTYNGNYANSALFLSGYSQSINSPEFLYYTSVDIWLATSGTDWGFAVDLGEANLADFSQQDLYSGAQNQSLSKFFISISDFQVGHVYGVWNVFVGGEIDSCWAFKVTSVTNGMTLEYTVYYYELFNPEKSSPGSNWDSLPQNQCVSVGSTNVAIYGYITTILLMVHLPAIFFH